MAQLDDSHLPFSLLQYYATSPYACSYLPGKTARSQVATPTHLVNTEVYSILVRSGFRRSGVFAYRPHCDQCTACTPVRLAVAAFHPSRSQRRAWTHGSSELEAFECPVRFDEAHYTLYQRYQSARHSGGGMDQDSHEQYMQFLLQSRVDTRLIEFRERGGEQHLRMVALLDVLDDGLSAVYTFFDPDWKRGSLGTYAVLWQIAQAAAFKLPYVYLGYWVANSPKMAYKVRFQPLEGLLDGAWKPVANQCTVPRPSER